MATESCSLFMCFLDGFPGGAQRRWTMLFFVIGVSGTMRKPSFQLCCAGMNARNPHGHWRARIRARVPALVDAAALGFERGARPPVVHAKAGLASRVDAADRRRAGNSRRDVERDGGAGAGVARGGGVGGAVGGDRQQPSDRRRAQVRTRAPRANDLHGTDGRTPPDETLD